MSKLLCYVRRVIAEPKWEAFRALGWVENLWPDLKWRLGTWWFWWAYGWPTRRRCPLCAGVGTRTSEGDRYGDSPFECELCRGKGKVHRRAYRPIRKRRLPWL